MEYSQLWEKRTERVREEDLLRYFHAKEKSGSSEPSGSGSNFSGFTICHMSDIDILQKCQKGKNKVKFETLYNGEWEKLGYPSKSEADLALCSIVSAFTQDKNQIDRLFSGSKLYREKWNRDDYKEQTINKALVRINEDPYRKYFSGTLFIVKSLADEIMEEYQFITFDDNKDIYYYKNGVYQNGGKDLILRLAQTKLGNYSKKKYGDEVKYYIQQETQISRNLVDSDIHIINLKNGLYDIIEDKFKPHTPRLLSTVQIPVKYDPNAGCSYIDKFLLEVVSEEDRQVLLEWIGYSMIPDTRMQKAVMLIGSGSNGKGVFLKLLTEFIGMDNTSGESLQNLEKDKFAVANLHGKLLNIFPDIASSKLYDNTMFKILVGGDLVRGERKFETAYQFKNTARLIFSANKVPSAQKDEYAFFRRWILIDFPHNFEGKDANKNLIESLTTEEELSGLLNKAIKALKRLLENGEFSYNKSIQDVQRMYQIKSDSVAAFASECVISLSEEDTLKSVVFDAYKAWCDKNGVKPESNNIFGKRFKELGYHWGKETTGARRNYWEGILIDMSNL